jgi:peptidoglycan hydrolase-like protein with peptidoglycan-binding domain
MIKKTIFILIIVISIPLISEASFFDDLLKNIDNTLNKSTFNNTTAVIPENKINNDTDINANPPTTNNCFLTPLEIGDENHNVQQLQEFLISLPNIYPEKLVTGYFGSLTKQAVMRFQLKYKKDILEPVGLSKPTGYVGQSTLNKLNQLSSCYKTTKLDAPTNQNTKIANDNIATTDLPVANPDNSPKNQSTNISGLQIYQLTEPLGCNKYA